MSQVFRIVDNGLRCFMEPCFQWDVLTAENELFAKVSKIEVSLGRDELISLHTIVQNGYSVTGHLTEYRTAEGASGTAFVVDDIVTP